MSRTNIFELLAKNNNMERDTIRLNSLFENRFFANSKAARMGYSLKDFVDHYCFMKWSNRGRCLNVKDYLETIDYSKLERNAKLGNLDSFLTVIEVIYNFWHIATNFIDSNVDKFEYFNVVNTLEEMMDDCLSEYNQKAFYSPEKEQCLIAEDSPQVTAAAEASEPEISLEIVRYNHRQLAGDIAKKKAILKTLGDYLEGRKKEISNINATLYKNITGALNNLNIRHNNTNPENKSYYHKAVAEMPQKELEAYYDDLYQLILLAILEIDNVQRQRDMSDLIQKVCEKEKAET